MAQGLDHAALLNRAAAFVAARRPLAARPLLATLRRARVDPVGVATLAVQIDIADDRLDAALDTLAAALIADPDEGRLYVLRADVLARAGRTADALRDAAEAVVRMPRDIAARGSLGLLLLEAGQRDDAITVLADVWRDAPAHQGVVQALALAHEVGGDVRAAADVLDQIIDYAPAEAWPYAASMLLHLRDSAPDRAVAVGLAARAAGCADAELAGLLGHAQDLCDDHEAAASTIAQARASKPFDADLHHLAAMAALAAPEPGHRWPAAYAREVFDVFAERFDARLTGLGYQAPTHLRDLLQAYAPVLRDAAPGFACGPALDLGCGTGLLAAALKDLPVGPFEGVDISPAMLARAADTGRYASLTEADIEAYLTAASPRFALVFAADVFCYLGDLAPSLRGIAQVLAPDGLALFTAEAATQAETSGGALGWVRRRSRRYAHTEAYLRMTAEASGLTIVSLAQHGLREEYGRTLPAHYIVARRAG